MENCEVLNLTLNNPTSEKIAANILDSESGSETIVIPAGSNGKIFTTTQGAANGDQLQDNNIAHSNYNKTTNILYVATASGLWIYNVNTDTGSIINISTSVLGDALPSDNLYFIEIDETNNILYIGHGLGMWIYNVNTNTGKSYIVGSGVSFGDNIPGTCRQVAVDFDNNILYAAGINYLWKLDLSTNTGDDITIASSGDNYPATNIPYTILYDSVDNNLYVGIFLEGIHLRELNTDNGVDINAGYSVTGDALPSNIILYRAEKIANDIYFSTNSGIWIFNYSSNTGEVINTATVVNGDALPDNRVYSLAYDSTKNRLFVASYQQLWELDLTTNTGTIISTVTDGNDRPSPYLSFQSFFVNGVFWDTLFGFGIWKYSDWDETSIINSNTGSDVDYNFLLNSLRFEPILVNKIVFYSSNSTQKFNNIKQVVNTMFGDSIERQIQPLDFEDPMNVDNKIHIEFDEPILIGPEEFLQMDLEAYTSVDMIFYYCQDDNVKMLDFAEIPFPDYGQISGAEEIEQKVKKNTIACAVKPFIVLLIIYLIYRSFKK